MKHNDPTMPSGSHQPLAVDRSGRATLALIALMTMAPLGASRALPPDEGASGDATRAGSSLVEAFDRIWGYATLYENPDNPVLERFAIRGRFQVDFPFFSSDQGDYAEPQIRRFQLGFKSRWLTDWIVHVEVDLDLSCEQDEVCDDDAYEGLTDAYLGWAPSKAFEFQIGKMSAPFTLDGSTSSRRLLTLERNNLSNNLWFPVEYHAGINVSGEPGTCAIWRASTRPARPSNSDPSTRATSCC
jgi:phosphate-selective porin OprO/OprP